MRSANRRQKLSTTVSTEAYDYLRALVESGAAASLAEAVDHAIEQARRAENRVRLARDTAAYFERLPSKAAREEARLEKVLGRLADEVDCED